MVSSLKIWLARSPDAPLRLNQSTLVVGLVGAGMSPVFAPMTKALGWPASLAEVKSHFGVRAVPAALGTK